MTAGLEPALATTANGRVRGVRDDRGFAFLGLPYAAAPRWRAPEPAPGWSAVRDAVAPGSACPQPERPVALFTHGAVLQTAEECLGLGVFTPELDGSRPVLVWVHGGGFAVGHGGASLYHGARLARAADAVVVSINYRLGSLGWLCHDDLAAEPGTARGNWGLLDVAAALRWVRENIAAFGGDPGAVTVAGQSAGALCALDLLVLAETEGLFSRVVLQSPPLGDLAQPRERGMRWASALSRAAGGRGDFDAARLRSLPAREIVALHETVNGEPEFRGTRGATPTIDPATLPVSPLEHPAARPEVDVLIGSTLEEGTFFFGSPWRPAPPHERVPDLVAHLCPEENPDVVLARRREAAREAGRPDDLQALLVDVATERMIAGPAREFAHARATATGREGGRVWRFRVDHRGGALGATHTVEVPLLFGTWADGDAGERLAGGGPDPAPAAHELASAWARFLRGQSPGWDPVALEDGPAAVGVFGGDAGFAVVPDPD